MRGMTYKITGALLVILGVFIALFYGFLAYADGRILPLVWAIVLLMIFFIQEWYYFHVGHGTYVDSRLSLVSLVLTIVAIIFLVLPTIIFFNAPLEYMAVYGMFLFIAGMAYLVAVGLLLINWIVSCKR